MHIKQKVIQFFILFQFIFISNSECAKIQCSNAINTGSVEQSLTTNQPSISLSEAEHLLRIFGRIKDSDTDSDWLNIFNMFSKQNITYKEFKLTAENQKYTTKPEIIKHFRDYLNFVLKYFNEEAVNLKHEALRENLPARGYTLVNNSDPYKSIELQSSINLKIISSELSKSIEILSTRYPEAVKNLPQIENSIKLIFYHNSHHNHIETDLPLASSGNLRNVGFTNGTNSTYEFNSDFLNTSKMVYFFPQILNKNIDINTYGQKLSSQYGTHGITIQYDSTMNKELGFISPYVMYEGDLNNLGKALGIGIYGNKEFMERYKLLLSQISTMESKDPEFLELSEMATNIRKDFENNINIHRDSQFLRDFTPNDFISMQKLLIKYYLLSMYSYNQESFTTLAESFDNDWDLFYENYKDFQRSYIGFDWEFKIPSILFLNKYKGLYNIR